MPTLKGRPFVGKTGFFYVTGPEIPVSNLNKSKKTEVLYIHHGAVPGGAPTSLRNMVQGVAQHKEFSCAVYCVREEMIPFFSVMDKVEVGKYPRTGLFTGRVFVGWSRGFSLNKLINLTLELCRAPFYIIREIKFLKRKKPDIVHLNSSILWMSAIAARICRIPIVWHIREASDDSRFNVVRLLYTRFIRRMAANVICIGPQEFAKIGGEKSNNVQIIYNSLAESYFSNQPYDKRELRKRLGLPTDSFLYLSLGGMSFRKGTYQFIAALEKLPETISAVLVGAKPDEVTVIEKGFQKIKHALEDFLIAKRLKGYYSWGYNSRVASLLARVDRKRIIMTGVVDNVQPYIKACDVVVFAGTTPHSARPVYEAWALDKPVIVFDTEVMRQDVDHDVDGVLVLTHTAEALAVSIKRLNEDSDFARKLGKAGSRKAGERFSMQINNKKIFAIYKGITGANSL